MKGTTLQTLLASARSPVRDTDAALPRAASSDAAPAFEFDAELSGPAKLSTPGFGAHAPGISSAGSISASRSGSQRPDRASEEIERDSDQAVGAKNLLSQVRDAQRARAAETAHAEPPKQIQDKVESSADRKADRHSSDSDDDAPVKTSIPASASSPAPDSATAAALATPLPDSHADTATPAADDGADSAVQTRSLANTQGSIKGPALWQRLKDLLGSEARDATAAALNDGSLQVEFSASMVRVQAAGSSAANAAGAALLPATNAPDTALSDDTNAKVLSLFAASLTGGARSLAVLATTSAPSSADQDQDQALQAVAMLASSDAARLLAMGSPATPAMPSIAAAANTPSPLMLLQDGWTDDLLGKVQSQVFEAQHEARIELHPQELGAMTIRITMGGGVPQVQFAADNPEARAALQASLPQLQQMFASAGLALPQVTIGERPSARAGSVDAASAAESATEAPRRRRVSASRNLDNYA